MVKDTKSFIEKARKVHGDKYDYSKVVYKKSHEKVCIICPEHGEFMQTPNNHLSGQGCPACGGNLKLTTESFIKRAQEVHGDKYDYSKVEYKDTKTKVCIICPEHGEFMQNPLRHLDGSNCPKCAHQSYVDTKETFIEKARKVHGDKYDYSKVEYVNSHTKVCITCQKHGDFFMLPTNHLRGKGCIKCRDEMASKKMLSNTKEFIEKARKVHGDKYDYSKVEYECSNKKVCIICPEHGEFMQTPNKHLSGSGCKKCHESKIETEIRVLLETNNIAYEDKKHFKWLKRQHLDFYLPDYNIAIECQGEQHFTEMRYRRKKPLEHTISLDKVKNLLCENNGVRLFYYLTDKTKSMAHNMPDFYENEKIFTDKNKLLSEIKKSGTL